MKEILADRCVCPSPQDSIGGSPPGSIGKNSLRKIKTCMPEALIHMAWNYIWAPALFHRFLSDSTGHQGQRNQTHRVLP